MFFICCDDFTDAVFWITILYLDSDSRGIQLHNLILTVTISCWWAISGHGMLLAQTSSVFQGSDNQ